MNEPDLQWQDENGPQDEERSLNFYKQEPADYSQLLIKTNQAIKAADSEAKVLIAGAAGGETRMLNFYREVSSLHSGGLMEALTQLYFNLMTIW